MKKKKNKYISFLIISLQVAVSAAILLWLLYQVDLKILVKLIRDGEIYLLGIGTIFFILAIILLQGSRLHMLIRQYTVVFSTSVKLQLISLFFNTFLPGNVGGDGYKVIYLRKKNNNNWAGPISLILFDRIIGLMVITLAGFFYFLFNYEKIISRLSSKTIYINKTVLFGFLFAVLCLVFFITRKKSILSKVKKFYLDCKSVLANISSVVLFKVIILSFAVHLFRMFGFYYFILFFNEKISFIDLVFVLFITAFISLLPISFGSLGIREGTIAMGMIMFGISKSNAAAVAFMNRGLLILFAVIGGIFYIFERKKKCSEK